MQAKEGGGAAAIVLVRPTLKFPETLDNRPQMWYNKTNLNNHILESSLRSISGAGQRSR